MTVVENLIALAAEANPTAFMQNFVRNGIFSQEQPAIPARFVQGWNEYVQRTPSITVEERRAVFANLFDMPIAYDTPSGAILFAKIKENGFQSLKQFVQSFLNSQTVGEAAIESNKANENEPPKITPATWVILGLAAVGALTILYGFGRLIRKIYS